MRKLTLTVLAVGFAALQPFANAQFGSGIVFDPTQATSLQRRKAAIRTHPPDDPRAQDALCAVSVSNL